MSNEAFEKWCKKYYGEVSIIIDPHEPLTEAKETPYLYYQAAWKGWKDSEVAQAEYIAQLELNNKFKDDAIAQLKLDLEKASDAAWNNFVAVEVINDYLIELDLLVITHEGGGKEAGLNIVDSFKKLQLKNSKMREALEVCKYDCHTGEVIGIAKEALGETNEH